jgi:hypothetical protein
VHTKPELPGGENTRFLKKIKKVNQEFAVIFNFWVKKVGAFPNLSGRAKGFQARSQISSGVKLNVDFVPSRDSGWEEEGV